MDESKTSCYQCQHSSVCFLKRQINTTLIESRILNFEAEDFNLVNSLIAVNCDLFVLGEGK